MTHRYKATALVSLGRGARAVLNAEQLERLAYRGCVEGKGGVRLRVQGGESNAASLKSPHTLTEPVQFKAGELIELVDEAPKALWSRLEGGESGEAPHVFDADGKRVEPGKKSGGKQSG